MNHPSEPVSKTSVAQKMRSKELAHSMKFGSPKLRDLLRQKCRLRYKEARLSSFDNKRELFGQSLVNATIREELRELNLNIELQEIIFKEMSEEALAWDLEEKAQQETNFLGALDDSADPFFCPICQKTLLDPVFGHYACSLCKLKFKCLQSFDHFQYLVLRKMVEHESSECNQTVTFFAEPIPNSDFSSLNTFCDGCDFYASF